MLLCVEIMCYPQTNDEFNQLVKIANKDYGQCYLIRDYKLCPEKQVILVGKKFGTATKDSYGYFPDSSLKYNDVTLIIFAGQVYFDKSNANIDWEKAKLQTYRDNFVVFTDKEQSYTLGRGGYLTQNTNYKNADKPDIENRLTYKKDYELTEVSEIFLNVIIQCGQLCLS
jgi:hypothetical protein